MFGVQPGGGKDTEMGVPPFFTTVFESFCGSPPTFPLTKSPVLKPSHRPCLPKYGAPCHPTPTSLFDSP